MPEMLQIGIDTGGTFTDFVVFDGHQLAIHKVLSSPAAPERAILQGLCELNLMGVPMRLIHGSTVATNAVLERKGVRTAFITNKGLRDILLIGRQARRELYNLTPKPVPPLVDRDLCLEVDTRLAADGTLLQDLDDAEIQRLLCEIRTLEPQAVAISLLFSFLDARQEQAIRDALPDHLFVSLSSEVLPEYREYERGITTWMNAYVGPLVQGYLQRMEQQLSAAKVSIMQSSGLSCNASQAGHLAVNLLLSGPAGGLEGARLVSQQAGYEHLMTLDMGGTSTDVALIDGAIRLSTEAKIGGYPVAVPMVDIHTIGAGGGSIAWVDEGGLLHVGPQSAGADPGPVCYGKGGEQVTVTDANLILGRLPASTQLGGNLKIDQASARAAMQKLADQLGLPSAEAAAAGVIALANEHMAGALRVISVQKGHDPAGFVLVCFGGAGGLHVCDLADALHMQTALVPVHAGVLSALGMLAAKPGRQLSRTLAVLLAEQPVDDLQAEFARLAAQGMAALQEEGHTPENMHIDKSLDLCYKGQSFTLNIPWHDETARAESVFHETHKQRYGHRLDVPVELVNVRIGVTALTVPPKLAELPANKPATSREQVILAGQDGLVDVWQREDLVPEQLIRGPAIIAEPVATSFVAAGWCCKVDISGNLHLSKMQA